jgi:phage terminase large subunit-like protein
MPSLLSAARRIARIEARLGPASLAAVDRTPWDWYAEECRCGLPAGECTVHPRARAAQRPPEGDWRTWLLLGGRAAGKTRTAAELVRYWAESGKARRIGLVAPTAADYRDTMIQGPSGLLAIAPPWNRPRFEPSKRRLTWPNGAIAICLSADQPERARGLQFDHLWCDELCAWTYPSRMWEIVLLCLRLGEQPRAVVTTTPKPIKLLTRILEDPTTRLSKETTFANARHLAPEFISEIAAMYDGTRLGDQELKAEIVDTSAAARFPGFSEAAARRRAGGVRPGVARPFGHRLRPVAARRRPVLPGPRAGRGDDRQRPPDHLHLRRLLRGR